MSELWTRYLKDRGTCDACETAKYHLHQARHQAYCKAVAAIEALALPKAGLATFAPERLMREGDRFVLIELSAYAKNWERFLRISTITLKVPDDEDGTPGNGLRAIDDLGQDRGLVTRAAFTLEARFGMPSKTDWNDPRFHGRFSLGSVLLPLDADIDDHPAGVRMKAYAQKALMTKLVMEDCPLAVAYLDDLLQLAALDGKIADEDLERDFTVSNLDGTLDVAMADARFDLATIDAALVADMRSMDWTHHYADRTVPGAHEKEMRIKRGLAALTLDTSIFTMRKTNTGWFGDLRPYLRDHPEAKAAVAAESAKTRKPAKAARKAA